MTETEKIAYLESQYNQLKAYQYKKELSDPFQLDTGKDSVEYA